MKTQKNAQERINIEANQPDLVYVEFINIYHSLQGHLDVAAYALDWNAHEPIIASGGRDRQILLWNVDHYFNTHGKIEDDNSTSNAMDSSEDLDAHQQ